ncbi:hypothetical protein WG219_20060 [Ectopseudomonas mendocina]|uniref:Uncharacterized protein n=1 Tax=Ectopseudomonas mendocina TaxID=300 RepID=A0ABZ2RN49_ECTME
MAIMTLSAAEIFDDLVSSAACVFFYSTLECAPLSMEQFACHCLTTKIFSGDVRKLTQLGYNYFAFRKS